MDLGAPSLRYGEVGIMTIDEVEVCRQLRQTVIDSQKDIDSRRAMGQFATPRDLSRQIVRETLPYLKRRSALRMLETSMGIGSFVSSAFKCMPGKIREVCGFELDEDFYKEALALWQGYPVKLVNCDFTKAKPEPLYDLVFSNPPYVRHHSIGTNDKLRLQKLVYELLGIRISGLAGLYCHFMLLSLAWMKVGAVGAWLIPSEWMSVNYGSAIRDFLTRKVKVLRIHRFDSEDVRFSDALVSSCVVWFKNSPPDDQDALFTFGSDLANPNNKRYINLERLRNADKWPPQDDEIAKVATLSEYFVIRRGIATGDNSFFVLSEEDVRSRGIPKEFLKPMLPSPRCLSTNHVTADKNGIPINTMRLFLLDCTGRDESSLPISVRSYIQEGADTVGKKKLCSSRNVWYEQEQRQPTRFLCSYMGRGNGTTSPVRFILNDSRAIVSNSYLMLYPKDVLKDVIESNPDYVEKVWKLLANIPAEAIKACGRSYGGGLYKVEPKELGNIPCGGLSDWIESRGSAKVDRVRV